MHTYKDIRLALIKVNLIAHDLGYLQDKFGFSDEDMQSVPQAPFNPGTPVFAHYTSARRWYAPHDLAKVNNSEIERVTEMDKKNMMCIGQHQIWSYQTQDLKVLQLSYLFKV